MSIDSYLNKPFRVDGRKFYIDKVEDRVTGANGYILCDEHDEHRANVSSFSDTGFSWFSYLLGVEVQGQIQYAELEKNLIIN